MINMENNYNKEIQNIQNQIDKVISDMFNNVISYMTGYNIIIDLEQNFKILQLLNVNDENKGT